MKNLFFFPTYKVVLVLVFASSSFAAFAQNDSIPPKSKSDFWRNVQVGGAFGLNIGSGFTDVTLAPSAIYNFNEYVALGVGLQGSRVSIKNEYSSWIYGGSAIALFNPIEEIQLSVELEQLRVNSEIKYMGEKFKDNFWNTALFIGGGYRMNNVTIGARYNLLFDKNKTVYADGFMPFVRVYF